MRTNLVIVILFVTLLVACETRSTEELLVRIDSLHNEIRLRDNLVLSMNAESGVLDSIYDDQSYILDAHLHTHYADRIQYYHENLKATSSILHKTKTLLESVSSESDAYRLMVFSLQDEVSLRDREIADINSLIRTTKQLFRGAAGEYQDQLNAKDREIEKLNAVIASLKESRIADDYFWEARFLEARAKKVYFAPRKKRDMLEESLELYQKSFALGNLDAEHHIHALKKLLFRN
jgi:hypothetical protein